MIRQEMDRRGAEEIERERQEELHGLRLKMSKAQRVQKLLESEVWKLDILPALEAEQDRLLMACATAPLTRGDDGRLPDADRVALNVSLSAGARANIEWLVGRINRIVADGEAAGKDIIRLEAEK